MALIDIDEEGTLTTDQATLDEHSDMLADLSVHLVALVDAASRTSSSECSAHEILVRWCRRFEFHLSETDAALTPLSHENTCRLPQYQEET